ncbi:unnamed protein product [Amoebophrya sp. A25]|nr:unnamed protein product [Amoebophrya sp. A25]|eukprot:GSA25T00011143001.1
MPGLGSDELRRAGTVAPNQFLRKSGSRGRAPSSGSSSASRSPRRSGRNKGRSKRGRRSAQTSSSSSSSSSDQSDRGSNSKNASRKGLPNPKSSSLNKVEDKSIKGPRAESKLNNSPAKSSRVLGSKDTARDSKKGNSPRTTTRGSPRGTRRDRSRSQSRGAGTRRRRSESRGKTRGPPRGNGGRRSPPRNYRDQRGGKGKGSTRSKDDRGGYSYNQSRRGGSRGRAPTSYAFRDRRGGGESGAAPKDYKRRPGSASNKDQSRAASRKSRSRSRRGVNPRQRSSSSSRSDDARGRKEEQEHDREEAGAADKTRGKPEREDRKGDAASKERQSSAADKREDERRSSKKRAETTKTAAGEKKEDGNGRQRDDGNSTKETKSAETSCNTPEDKQTDSAPDVASRLQPKAVREAKEEPEQDNEDHKLDGTAIERDAEKDKAQVYVDITQHVGFDVGGGAGGGKDSFHGDGESQSPHDMSSRNSSKENNPFASTEDHDNLLAGAGSEQSAPMVVDELSRNDDPRPPLGNGEASNRNNPFFVAEDDDPKNNVDDHDSTKGAFAVAAQAHVDASEHEKQAAQVLDVEGEPLSVLAEDPQVLQRGDQQDESEDDKGQQGAVCIAEHLSSSDDDDEDRKSLPRRKNKKARATRDDVEDHDDIVVDNEDGPEEEGEGGRRDKKGASSSDSELVIQLSENQRARMDGFRKEQEGMIKWRRLHDHGWQWKKWTEREWQKPPAINGAMTGDEPGARYVDREKFLKDMRERRAERDKRVELDRSDWQRPNKGKAPRGKNGYGRLLSKGGTNYGFDDDEGNGKGGRAKNPGTKNSSDAEEGASASGDETAGGVAGKPREARNFDLENEIEVERLRAEGVDASMPIARHQRLLYDDRRLDMRADGLHSERQPRNDRDRRQSPDGKGNGKKGKGGKPRPEPRWGHDGFEAMMQEDAGGPPQGPRPKIVLLEANPAVRADRDKVANGKGERRKGNLAANADDLQNKNRPSPQGVSTSQGLHIVKGPRAARIAGLVVRKRREVQLDDAAELTSSKEDGEAEPRPNKSINTSSSSSPTTTLNYKEDRVTVNQVSFKAGKKRPNTEVREEQNGEGDPPSSRAASPVVVRRRGVDQHVEGNKARNRSFEMATGAATGGGVARTKNREQLIRPRTEEKQVRGSQVSHDDAVCSRKLLHSKVNKASRIKERAADSSSEDEDDTGARAPNAAKDYKGHLVRLRIKEPKKGLEETKKGSLGSKQVSARAGVTRLKKRDADASHDSSSSDAEEDRNAKARRKSRRIIKQEPKKATSNSSAADAIEKASTSKWKVAKDDSAHHKRSSRNENKPKRAVNKARRGHASSSEEVDGEGDMKRDMKKRHRKGEKENVGKKASATTGTAKFAKRSRRIEREDENDSSSSSSVERKKAEGPSKKSKRAGAAKSTTTTTGGGFSRRDKDHDRGHSTKKRRRLPEKNDSSTDEEQEEEKAKAPRTKERVRHKGLPPASENTNRSTTSKVKLRSSRQAASSSDEGSSPAVEPRVVRDEAYEKRKQAKLEAIRKARNS